MNHYYRVAILGYPLEPLTYASFFELEIGSLVGVELRSKKRDGVILEAVANPEFNCKELERRAGYYPKKIIEIAKFIKTYYFCSIGEALALFNPYHSSPILSFDKINTNITLSLKQSNALEFLFEHDASLLFGDTGAGKTEIYIKAIERVLNENKSALLLMPEISLTPQILKRLEVVFGESVATWHSKLTKKERLEILENLKNRKIRVVAGARSALFLPIIDLGIIIVDEEHDDAYKSQNRPRYSARDLALLFGKKLHIRTILGSATPSLVSYYRLPYFRLRGGFFNSKKRVEFDTSTSYLSSKILSTLRQNIDNKKQSIIFLPTRGNFKHIICSGCGKSVECPFCSVSMSLHKQKNILMCHYCNYACKIPTKCQDCQCEEFISHREGTSELVEDLNSAFENAVIQKFDRDEIKTHSKLKKVLKDFNNNKIDILAGTQMLSKGHDYHNVSLAVILGIDFVLKSADFRARERALSLLLQIAGRAGRRDSGDVIVATKNSDFFQRYIDDYEIFLKDELEFRKDLYPPFTRLALLIFAHKIPKVANDSMLNSLEILKNLDIDIVGYGEAMIYKIQNRYRYYILLRANSAKKIIESINYANLKNCEVDIDPINFS